MPSGTGGWRIPGPSRDAADGIHGPFRVTPDGVVARGWLRTANSRVRQSIRLVMVLPFSSACKTRSGSGPRWTLPGCRVVRVVTGRERGPGETAQQRMPRTPNRPHPGYRRAAMRRLRKRMRSGRFSWRRYSVTRPTAVLGTMRPPRNRKWFFHWSRRGLNRRTRRPVSASMEARSLPLWRLQKEQRCRI